MQHIWKANRFPNCEVNFFKEKIEAYLKDPQFIQIHDEVVDQVEDYLKYLRDFIKLDTTLKNLENQRQQKLKQLVTISEEYKDLRKFEQIGPSLLVSIREIVLKIVIAIKKIYGLKNPLYLQELKKEET